MSDRFMHLMASSAGPVAFQSMKESGMFKVEVRSPYNYDRDAVSRETGFSSELPSRTKQSFRDECDINTIVRRFGLTGEMPPPLSPQFGDFSNVVDFQTAMNAIRHAGESFMTLPASLRSRFDNDPSKLIAFLENKANFDEAVKLGLVNPPPLPVQQEAPPAPVAPSGA